MGHKGGTPRQRVAENRKIEFPHPVAETAEQAAENVKFLFGLLDLGLREHGCHAIALTVCCHGRNGDSLKTIVYPDGELSEKVADAIGAVYSSEETIH